MGWIGDAILAGVLQGLLEWLPVSSSGQVTLFYYRVLGVDALLAYRLSLSAHLGTALSAIAYYREIVFRIHAERLWLRVMALPTVSALPVGYATYMYIAGWSPGYIEPLIGASLIATGLLLATLRTRSYRDIDTITNLELLLVGVLEGLSVIPGVSRSAVTITSLTLLGFNAVDSVKASFLMAIPVTLAASLYEVTGGGLTGVRAVYIVTAIISALAAGLASIDFMTRLAKRLANRIPLLLVSLGLIILALHTPFLAS